MNFVFYDTETTGTRRWFDQILQFAAVATDEHFREQESIALRCRRMAHVLPSAGAMLATGLKPDDLDSQPLSHYQMIRQVHERMRAWAPAVFMGFNSIEFDEELLRQAFYQTLLPAFVTNTGGSQRADLLKIIHALYVLMPSGIRIPQRDDGKITFRLGALCKSNDIVQKQAHDALSDVHDTIALAKLVRDRAPDIFARGVQSGQKSFVTQILRQKPVLLWAGCEYNRPYSRWLTFLGENSKRPNEMICFDLATDPAAFDEQLTGVLRLRTNDQPFLAEPELVALYQSGEVDAAMAARAQWIRTNPEFARNIIAAVEAQCEPYAKSEHIEEQIYEGFASDADRRHMENFHGTPWEGRGSICRQFSDERFQKLAWRLLFSEKPELLEENERRRFKEKIAARLHMTEKAPWRTFARAFEGVEIERRNPRLTPEAREHLQLIADYLERLQAEWAV